MTQFIIGIIIIGMAAAIGWFGTHLATEGWRKWKHPESISENKTSKNMKIEEPTFSEKVDTVNFSLGEHGITSGHKFVALEKEAKEPFNLRGYSPVRLYIEDGKPYADVKIYGGSGLPAIEINRNKLKNKPHNWDFNSNINALEVVNENQIPIYQFYYKTPTHIVINGIFPFPNGLILANASGVIMNPTIPTTFQLKRIFKYPSWKYPGEYDENR